MKRYAGIFCILILVSILFSGCAFLSIQHDTSNAIFVVIPLGTKGGLMEGGLSSYLLASAGDTNFIALDAGTLLTGLQQAKRKGSLKGIEIPPGSPLSLEGVVMRNHIKAYLISHAHMDHIAGMVINSPSDSSKPILGLPSTIDTIRDHIFNWKTWPNFGDEGKGIKLKKYQYVRLKPERKYTLQHTDMTVIPYELSHSGGYLSTAFLIESNGGYMLYFGDCGPDALEKSDKMRKVWEVAAPLARDRKLHGIFLESSFPCSHPDHLLFGHLTPKWMMEELRIFAHLVNSTHPESALNGLKVVVTHVKPTLNRDDSPEILIMKELSEMNNLGVDFILPEAGGSILF